MKKVILPVLAVLNLAGCQKTTVEPEHAPADSEAAFETDFSLQYQQQAFLPGTAQPELTLRLDDLAYSFCPEEVTCVMGTSAWPKLSVTDAQGQTQRVELPWTNPLRVPSNEWLDTTSVRANNQRYVLTYRRWHLEKPLGRGVYAAKSDFTLWFRVGRASN